MIVMFVISGDDGDGSTSESERSTTALSTQSNQRYKGRTDGSTAFILGRRLWIFHIIVAVTVAVYLNIDMTVESELTNDFYSPGDSRLLPVSAVLYGSITMKVTGTIATTASLYLVESPKVLTEDNNTVSFKERGSIAFMTFYFWDFYLYPNSNISVNVCTNQRPLELFIIKGKEKARKWEQAQVHRERYAEKRDKGIKVCPNMTNLRYTVHEEDKYYVVVFNYKNMNAPWFNIELNIERFEYSSNTLPMSTPKCMASPYGECTLNIPFSFEDKYALIITSIPTEVIWDENVEIEIAHSYRITTYTFVAGAYFLLTWVYCQYCCS